MADQQHTGEYYIITFYFGKPFIIIFSILSGDTTGTKIHTSPLEQIKLNRINTGQINSLTPNVPVWCGLFLCAHGHCRAPSVLKPDHTVLGNVKQTSEGWEVDVNHCEIAG